jgi:hypothetical protein
VESDKKSISSLDPAPPTPSSPHMPNEIGLPPNSAETNNENHSMFQSKRLCERWLDNLFMVLYEVTPFTIELMVGFKSIHTMESRMGTFHKTASTVP